MTSQSQLASGKRARRQLAQAKVLIAAQAAVAQQHAATAHSIDPRLWWQQLLQEEADLQQLETFATCWNIRCSHGLWTDLHDRSERLAYAMASCIAQMEGR